MDVSQKFYQIFSKATQRAAKKLKTMEPRSGDLVLEAALGEDANKGLARLDPKAFSKLGIMPGDKIVIKGRSTAFAKAAVGYQGDIGRNDIRLDPSMRRQCGASIGDPVKVFKA